MVELQLPKLTVRVRFPSLAPKKSYYFDTTFFIHYGVMVYHHATCLRAYHQKERFFRSFFAYHHASACIKLRNDDIQCSALMIYRNKLRMIYTFCESDQTCKIFLFLTAKSKSFTLYPHRSICGVSFNY